MSTNPQQHDFEIPSLGPRRFASPLDLSDSPGDAKGDFVSDEMRVALEPTFLAGGSPSTLSLELAGPRQRIFFDPAKTKAAIVTCGGLCPGINNVVRAIVFELAYNYGVPDVLGIRYGYDGLNPAVARPPKKLACGDVSNIHHHGGTILGTCRGPQEPRVTVDYLQSEGVNLLFCIGGDGTQRGAHAIAEEVKRRGADVAIVGVPKTIDNDVAYCHNTFGYFTAVTEAGEVINRAHVEAKSVLNGVGLVKLMGREAGFVAAAATIASGEANFCLIPELPIELDGACGLLEKLKRRLAHREHAVIVVAEGAGQHLFEGDSGRDASGNRKLGDVGVHLKQRIEAYLAAQKIPVAVRYFDPSYMIRSVPATAVDALLCESFARAAVHAGMAGKTDVLIGYWNRHYVHVPLAACAASKKRLDPESDLWKSVLALTGQDKW